MHNSALELDCIGVPSGKVTWMGVCAALFVCGVFSEMYVAVHPESAIA